MFGSAILEKFVRGNTAAGIELELSQDGGLHLNYCLLKKSKGKLTMASSASGLDNVEALKKTTSTDIPLCVVINGRGVIHKKISVSENEVEQSLISKVLPGANPEEFYAKKTEIGEETAFVSVIRKTAADELLSKLKEHGYFVTSVSLGPFALSSVLPWMDLSKTESVSINGHRLHISDNSIVDYGYEKSDNAENSINISGEQVNEKCAIAFAAAFGYFFQQEENSMSVPFVQGSAKEFEHKKIFQAGGWAALIIFFSALMLNFFLFSHYNSLAEELNTKVFKSKDELAGIASLKDELQQKQKFLDRMGLLESSRTSFYADRIAADLPKTIQLTDMFINPAEKDIKEGKKEMRFITKKINIAGQCKKSAELNDWVKLLKEKDWIQSVNVQNYSQENPAEHGSFQVQIAIK